MQVAAIRDAMAKFGQCGFDAGDAERRRTHAGAAATGSFFQGNADQGNGRGLRIHRHCSEG
jgi:hypothetical protein